MKNKSVKRTELLDKRILNSLISEKERVMVDSLWKTYNVLFDVV